MGRKLNPFVKLDKDAAEWALGHAPGRPTLSRRVGRVLDGLTGCGEDAGTHAFHLALFVGAIAFMRKGIK